MQIFHFILTGTDQHTSITIYFFVKFTIEAEQVKMRGRTINRLIFEDEKSFTVKI